MNIDEICSSIKNQKYKEIILNDSACDDFEYRMKSIVKSFEYILNEKSEFEK